MSTLRENLKILKLIHRRRESSTNIFRQQLKKGFSEKPLAIKTVTNPTLSVIIVNFNNLELIDHCLRCLKKNSTIEKEILIVDNGSDAKTKRYLKLLTGPKLFFLPKNRHFLRAANLGASRARGKYILFLNTDCFINEQAIESSIAKLKNIPKIGVIGAKVLNPDRTVQEAGSMILKDGQPYMCGWLRPQNSADISFDRYVEYVSGCFFLTTRSLFKKLKGFDTRFSPAYFEDTDFCFRAAKKGFRILYNSEATVIHLLQGSNGPQPSAHELMKRNQIKFYKKHRAVLKNRPELTYLNYLKYRSAGARKRVLIVVTSISRINSSFLKKKSQRWINSSFSVTILCLKQGSYLNQSAYGISRFVEIIPLKQISKSKEFFKSRSGLYDLVWVEGKTTISKYRKEIKNLSPVNGRLILNSNGQT